MTIKEKYGIGDDLLTMANIDVWVNTDKDKLKISFSKKLDYKLQGLSDEDDMKFRESMRRVIEMYVGLCSSPETLYSFHIDAYVTLVEFMNGTA